MGGCFWLSLQAQKGDIYFTELAERVEYGNYDQPAGEQSAQPGVRWGAPPRSPNRESAGVHRQDPPVVSEASISGVQSN